MRQMSLILFCALPVAFGGCGFAQNVRMNLVYSPLLSATDRVDHHRHMQMGREAFAEMAQSFPDYEYSCDYRRGFVEGFADYLDFGGIGEPPPVPPSIYRISRYETPAGLGMIEDWTVGFRHGAATAKASGLRCLVTVPVYKGPTVAAANRAAPEMPTPATAPGSDVPLPAPKPIDPPAEYAPAYGQRK